jgi:hypothetical protein
MSEKNYIFAVPGGGVFSRFLQCAIIPLAGCDYDDIYLTASHFWLEVPGGDPRHKQLIIDRIHDAEEYGIKNPYDLLFNYFLEQKCDVSFTNCGFLPIGNLYTSNNKIEQSPRFRDYKRVVNRLRFKNSLLNDIEKRSSAINWSKTLSVHIRLSTIAIHGHDQVNFNHYLNQIERELAGKNFNSIFVASDNNESIQKIENYFGNIVHYNRDFHRLPSEQNEGLSWEYDNYFKKHYWTESIIDAMMLAKAPKLLCRTSNFSNAAIVFGDFEEIHRL